MVFDYIWAIIIAVIIISDIVIVIAREKTWSEVTKGWRKGKLPMTAFAVMYLAAHFTMDPLFWKPAWLGLVVLPVACIAIQIIHALRGYKYSLILNIIYVKTGFISGWLFWSF